MAKYYAWSEIRNGGTVEEVSLPNGGTRTVVTSRNSFPAGSQVTKAKIGCTDEDWDNFLAGGSVRPYPYPDGVDEYTSPSRAMIQQLVDPTGDIDTDKLFELGLTTENVPEGA